MPKENYLKRALSQRSQAWIQLVGGILCLRSPVHSWWAAFLPQAPNCSLNRMYVQCYLMFLFTDDNLVKPVWTSFNFWFCVSLRSPSGICFAIILYYNPIQIYSYLCLIYVRKVYLWIYNFYSPLFFSQVIRIWKICKCTYTVKVKEPIHESLDHLVYLDENFGGKGLNDCLMMNESTHNILNN